MSIKEYVSLRKEEMKQLITKYKINLKLIIIQVNDNSSSSIYVKGKVRDGKEMGVRTEVVKLPPYTSQFKLISVINKYNYDPSVTGILVQLPLPEKIDENVIKQAIYPSKDVDGFNFKSKIIPCTSRGILDYLNHKNVKLEGKNTVIIGRSNIVGKPTAKLFLENNANVTILHSKTKIDDMKVYVKNADIIVIAIGKEGFLDNTFDYKKDCIIIDVGINKTAQGLKGDTKPGLPVKLQTPVPGGVGLLTRLALYENLLEMN